MSYQPSEEAETYVAWSERESVAAFIEYLNDHPDELRRLLEASPVVKSIGIYRQMRADLYGDIHIYGIKEQP